MKNIHGDLSVMEKNDKVQELPHFSSILSNKNAIDFSKLQIDS